MLVPLCLGTEMTTDICHSSWMFWTGCSACTAVFADKGRKGKVQHAPSSVAPPHCWHSFVQFLFVLCIMCFLKIAPAWVCCVNYTSSLKMFSPVFNITAVRVICAGRINYLWCKKNFCGIWGISAEMNHGPLWGLLYSRHTQLPRLD